MTVLKPAEVLGLLLLAGFSREHALVMTVVAKHESGWDPKNIGDQKLALFGSDGLWQEFTGAHSPTELLGHGGSSTKNWTEALRDELFDPWTNAKAAHVVFKEQGYQAWSTYNDGHNTVAWKREVDAIRKITSTTARAAAARFLKVHAADSPAAAAAADEAAVATTPVKASTKYNWAPWEQATTDSHGPRPGAVALMKWCLAHIPGTTDMGIYNPRNTAGGNLSDHSEGRAIDVGGSIAVGEKVLALLGPHGQELRLDYAIHRAPSGQTRIYSAKTPDGRPYTGDPHTSHIHISMTRHGGETLTRAILDRVLGSAPTPAPTPTPSPKPAQVPFPGASHFVLGQSDPAVGQLKRWLAAIQAPFHMDLSDDTYGSGVVANVKHFQLQEGFTGADADGIVGPKSWAWIQSKATG